MNIGNLKANESGVLVGRITTVALALTAPGKPRYAPFANKPLSG